MLYIAITGLALQLEMALTDGGGAPGTPGAAGPPGQGPDSPEHVFHLLLLRMHRGDIIGVSGTVLDVACGLALIVLCVTGLYVYGEMLLRRWKQGRKKLFW